MIVGYKSIRVVISKIYRDLGINEEIAESSIVEWIAEALNMIGAYSQYSEVSDCLELKNGKAKLPCDFYKLVDVRFNGNPMYWSTNTNANNYQCNNCNIPVCLNNNCQYTFYINDSYLISNINTDNSANVCLVYLAIPVDEDGFPLIPDNIYYDKALTAYVTSMLDYQDWRKGKCTDKVYEKSNQDWLFYVNSARGAANMPNIAQIQNIKNLWQRLIPNQNGYDLAFKNINRKENRRLH